MFSGGSAARLVFALKLPAARLEAWEWERQADWLQITPPHRLPLISSPFSSAPYNEAEWKRPVSGAEWDFHSKLKWNLLTGCFYLSHKHTQHTQRQGSPTLMERCLLSCRIISSVIRSVLVGLQRSRGYGDLKERINKKPSLKIMLGFQPCK